METDMLPKWYKIPDLPLLTKEQEIELARIIKKHGDGSDKGEKAINMMMEHNMRLVITVAQKFTNRGLPIEELVSEGMIGLREAALRYDPTLDHANDAKFSTYACFWIKRSIRRHVNSAKVVSPATHLAEKYGKYLAMFSQYESKHGVPPSIEWLMVKTGFNRKTVVSLMQSMPVNISIDAQDEEVQSLHNRLSVDAHAHTDPMDMEDIRSVILEMLEDIEVIDSRKREILIKRFGLDGNPPMTLEEVGDFMKVTRERIRQLEHQALQALKNKLDENDRFVEMCHVFNQIVDNREASYGASIC